jgi:hypothetical protein
VSEQEHHPRMARTRLPLSIGTAGKGWGHDISGQEPSQA